MQLRITKHEDFGPGWAWLEIFAAVPKGFTFQLSAPNSQKPYLGPHGWQSGPYDFEPREVASTAGGTRILVGPEIVDNMHEDMLVKLEITATGYVARAHWPDIPVSGVHDPAASDGEPTPHVLRPQPQRPVSQHLGQQERSDVPPLAAQTPGHSRHWTERLRHEATASMQAIQQMTPAAAIPLASIAFLVFAALGYAYVDSRWSFPTDMPGPAVAQAGETQRLLVAGERNPDRLFSLGTMLHRTPGASRELGLQAIQRAAEYNHVPALIWLGKAADPVRTEWQDTMREPNAAEALAAYGKAAGLGNQEARDLSAGVCDHLRRRARSANEVRARDTTC
jgi:hypothetical protein